MKIAIFLLTFLPAVAMQNYCTKFVLWNREYVFDNRAVKIVKSSPGKIFFAQTGGPSCELMSDCLRLLKRYKGYIRDNFYIGGDGYVYEGFGWHNVNKRYGQNRNDISVAFIGDFSNKPLSKEMAETAKNLVLCGVQHRKLNYFFSVYTENDFKCTKQSSNGVDQEIDKWMAHGLDGPLVKC